MARILCVGAVVCDQVFWVPTIPTEPVKILASDHGIFGGGMAATAAIAVRALGGESAFLGRVGNDDSGTTVCRLLAEAAVDIDHIRIVDGGRTPVSALLVDLAGERLLAAFPGAGLDVDPGHPPETVLRNADAVLGDVRWPEGVTTIFRRAGGAGVPRVLDADIAPPEIITMLLRLTDHAIFSERGLAAYTGLADHRAALTRVAQETDATLGVTLGPRGALLHVQNRSIAVPGYSVSVVDTNGAGDVFHGAYALAIAEGAIPADAAAFANAAAAAKCTMSRGWHGMPDRTRVTALMKESLA